MLAGFILGALSSAAIGGYYFFGPRGRQHRDDMERWVLKAKAEVLDGMGRIQDVTEDQYHRIVDEVADRYGQMTDVGRDRARRFSQRFKERWQEMREKARVARDRAERELEEEDRNY